MSLVAERVALVTGAGSGIGRAVAARFIRDGWSVAACDIDPRGLSALGDKDQLLGARVDVRDDEAVAGFVTHAVERFGGLDALLCVAGIEIDRRLDELEVGQWDTVLDTNLKGTFLTVRHSLEHLVSGGGVVVTTGSVLGRAAIPTVGAYAASKAGVEALTRSIAIDHAADGVRAICVLPGATETPLMWQNAAPAEVAALRPEVQAEIPLGFIADPADIAAAYAWAVSDEARFMTGSTLVLDGGALARIAANH